MTLPLAPFYTGTTNCSIGWTFYNLFIFLQEDTSYSYNKKLKKAKKQKKRNDGGDELLKLNQSLVAIDGKRLRVEEKRMAVEEKRMAVEEKRLKVQEDLLNLATMAYNRWASTPTTLDELFKTISPEDWSL